jgi:hypothetical protein
MKNKLLRKLREGAKDLIYILPINGDDSNMCVCDKSYCFRKIDYVYYYVDKEGVIRYNRGSIQRKIGEKPSVTRNTIDDVYPILMDKRREYILSEIDYLRRERKEKETEKREKISIEKYKKKF